MSIRKCKIWNDHNRDYTEVFNENEITIPAKKFIVMEEPEAVGFMGSFTPIKRDAQGRDLAPKMLRLEVVTDGSQVTNFNEHVCMACKKEFKSKNELNVHASENHLEVMVDEDARQSVKKTAKP